MLSTGLAHRFYTQTAAALAGHRASRRRFRASLACTFRSGPVAIIGGVGTSGSMSGVVRVIRRLVGFLLVGRSGWSKLLLLLDSACVGVLVFDKVGNILSLLDLEPSYFLAILSNMYSCVCLAPAGDVRRGGSYFFFECNIFLLLKEYVDVLSSPFRLRRKG